MELRYLHRAHVEQLSREVAAALEKSGFDALAVHSGAPLKRTQADDQYWPLRPTPHFQHWLPLAEPGCLLIVTPGRKPVLVRPPAQSFWEAPPPLETDYFWDSFEVVERPPALPGSRLAFSGDAASRELCEAGAARAISSGRCRRELRRVRLGRYPHLGEGWRKRRLDLCPAGLRHGGDAEADVRGGAGGDAVRGAARRVAPAG